MSGWASSTCHVTPSSLLYSMPVPSPLAKLREHDAIGDIQYAGRVDGLWRRSIATVSVPPGGAPASPNFAIAGTHPIRDEARFRFELPEATHVRIDLFDVSGRRVPGGIDETLPAGKHEVRLTSRDLAPGIYMARFRGAGRSEAVRLVRIG